MSNQRREAYRLGQIVSARVEKLFSFGVFTLLPDGTEAYVRRRELTQAGNLDPRQVVKEGQQVQTRVIRLGTPKSKLELSIRQAEPDPWEAFARATELRETVVATVKNLSTGGAFVQLVPGVDGLIPLKELAPWPIERPGDLLWPDDHVEAMVTHMDPKSKRLRLSIRQQMLLTARAEQIAEHIRAGGEPPDPLPESDATAQTEPEPGPEPLLGLHDLGPVLVVDDHEDVQREMTIWLQDRGSQADGVRCPKDGLAQAVQIQYSVALVDLDLDGEDGLDFIRDLRETSPKTQIIVMSIPEWIASKSEDLEALQVVEVFAKPLDLDEVQETLAQIAQGETVGPFRATSREHSEPEVSSFQQLAEVMRSGTPLETRLEKGLEDLVHFTQAELGVLFHLDPISWQVRIVAQVGQLSLDDTGLEDLSASPVKDLVVEGGEAYVANLSTQARRRYQKLLDVVEFESCVGVPVSAAGRTEHALFLFRRDPEGFSRYRLRDAYALATLLGVALESEALEARIEAVSPFLLSGQLAAAFGHDVFNEMSALELQVINLHSASQYMGDDAEPSSGNTLLDRVERLLESAADLKRTASAFRQLVRAEDQRQLDVNDVIQRSIRLLRTMIRWEGIRIEQDLPPELPLVFGSSIRLQQVFLNVMLNAIQHTGQKLDHWDQGYGKLTITTGVEPGSVPTVWVRIADTGPGIHYRMWNNIFALGFSTRAKGTGLGLFIAQSLVESMGGTIYVEESRIPTGTTFRIDLPTTRTGENEG